MTGKKPGKPENHAFQGGRRDATRAFRRLAGLAAAMFLAASLPPPSPAAEPPTTLEQAAALRADGRFDEAIELLRVESRTIKEADGDESLRLLPVNDLAAEILVDKAAFETAESLLSKTIAIRQQLVDAGERDQALGLCRSLLVLSRLQAADRRVPDAIASARRGLVTADTAAVPRVEWLAAGRQTIEAAVAATEALVGPGDDATLETREQAATAFESLGIFDAAIEQRRLILAGLATRGESARRDVALATARLCRLMMTAGRADDAIAVLGDAATATPEEKVEVERLLGEARLAAGQFSAAEASFDRVLAETRAAQGPPTPASMGDRLRRLLVAVRRDPSGPLPAWFDQFLQAVKPGAPGTSAAPADLAAAGAVMIAKGQPAAAVPPLTEAWRLVSAAKSPAPGVVADLAGRLAAARMQAGDAKNARTLAEPALATAERTLGPGDAAVGFLRLALADALCRSGDAPAAATVADAALRRGLPRPDDPWEEYATSVIDRIAAATATGDLPDRFVAARVAQFGRQHPHVGAAWSLFGAARLAAGDWPAAAKCFSDAIAIQTAGLGADHPEVAASLTLLAHAERAGGDPVRAAATAARALAAWEQAAGPNHPGTLAAAEVLVASKLDSRDPTEVVDLLRRLGTADATPDPVRRAGHLVRLAGLAAARDKAEADRCLGTALGLPCWENDAKLPDEGRERLARTAARAAAVYRAIGDAVRGDETLRRARSLALRTKDSRRVLADVERMAADDGASAASP